MLSLFQNEHVGIRNRWMTASQQYAANNMVDLDDQGIVIIHFLKLPYYIVTFLL